jgi:molecular chaperone GrpE
MSEDTDNTDKLGETAEELGEELADLVEEAHAEAGEAGATEEGAEVEVEEELSPTEALAKERDELFEQLQRVSADYQNYIKRADQNLMTRIQFAQGDQLRAILPLLDHLDRALGVEYEGDEAKGLFEGVRIMKEEMLSVFRGLGVERVEPVVGEKFDPHMHEAMMQQPVEGLEPNHIAMAFDAGYVYKGRTLRPAKVSVTPDA